MMAARRCRHPDRPRRLCRLRTLLNAIIPMPKRELVVVADDAALVALPRAVADFPVRVIDWHDASGLSSVGDAALLVDVDLRNLAKVRLIKDNLPPRRRDQCRIVAVERGSHQARAQAHGLDA